MSPSQPVTLSARTVDEYELTRTQQRIWTSQRLDPTIPLANMGKRHRILGPLDAPLLVRAFADVVAGSDALRTVVGERDGRAVGRVLASAPATTEVIDLDGAHLDAWCAERISRPIDATSCAYDSVLLRHGAHDWTWWLDLHHVVTDAWGSTIVYRRTADRYAALRNDADAPIAELPPPFVEHVRAVEERAMRGRSAAQREERLAAWAEMQLPAPAPLTPFGLRTSRTSSAIRLPVPLDEAAHRRLEVAVHDTYATISPQLSLLAVLASSAAVAMHRLDGRRELRVGLPIHHRSGPVAPQVIGPLMELYPATVLIDADDTFDTLVRRTLAEVMGVLGRARPHESPPGDYEVVVNVINASYPDFAGMPTTTTWERSPHVDPAHPIRLHAFDYGGATVEDGAPAADSTRSFEIDVNTGVVPAASAPHFAEHLAVILAAACETPDRLVADVDIITADERVALETLNPQPVVRGEPVPVHVAVRDALVASPHWIVVDGPGGPVSAREFDDRVLRTMSWLRHRNVQRGDRVGLRMHRGADVLVAIHAVLRCGAAFVMLDPGHPTARHDAVVDDAGLRLIVDDLVDIGDLRSPTVPVSAETTLDDLAYVLYTSGSTGAPKGVPISHRGLADYLRFAVDAYIGPTDPAPTVALHSSLVFDLTITSLFLSFLTGGCTVVFPQEPVDALDSIARDDRITFLKLTPSQLEVFNRMAAPDRPLRSVVVGGEAFRRPTADALTQRCRPGVRIFNEYGPTEAVVGCMVHEWDPDVDVDADVPIGHAAPGCEVAIVDPSGHPTAVGAWGELFVRRPGMARHYLNRPDLTADRFVDLAAIPGAIPEAIDGGDGQRAPWYRTGDRARVVRPGVAVYGGRMDDQLNVNGIRLEPAEVEAALVSHPDVSSALVRLWSPSDRRPGVIERCVRCGLGIDVPGIELDVTGVCSTCRSFDAVAPQAAAWFRTEADLADRLAVARARSTGDYDCLHLLSGGKDSSYALYQLVERGWRVHALTLDNGFISEGAKENIRRSIADLDVTHEFATTSAMNEIFRDSLDRHSNVCQGCYKTIYTLAVARAEELGIPVIVTGLSRGQFFETRLIPAQFEEGRFDAEAIDATVLEARRVYHHTTDAVTELLPEQSVFAPRTDGTSVLDEIEFVDFYRYVDVELSEMYRFLETNAPWVRPADTGRSTNCLINVAGIHVHTNERGYHNYAEPYSWDVRLGHKTREEALAELDDAIAPDEVDQLLAQVGYETKDVRVLTAWYCSVDGSDLDPADLRRHLRGLLADHALPSAFVRLDEMPLAASAKVDIAALPAPTRFHRSGADVIEPTTEIERMLCELVADVLRIDRVGVTDDFFDLGGDSLAALEVVATVVHRFDVDLPDAAVFRHRTVGELAEVVEAAIAAGGPVAVIPEVPTDAPLPLSSGEEAMLFDYRMDPGNTRYNVTRLYRLAGDVDVERLEGAIRRVVAAHATLTTSYAADRRPLDEPVEIVRLAPTDAAGFRAFAMRQRAVPFDLDRGPLVRVHIAALGPAGTAVLIGMHHITIDAVTFDLFWEQIAAAYDGAGAPHLPVTYASHGAWQRSRAASHAEFWRTERAAAAAAAGGPSAPLGCAAPTSPQPDGYLHRTIDLTAGDLHVGPATTPFIAALTAAGVTVGRFAARTEVELGISVSIKDHPSAASLVGYCLNTVPIRLSIAGDVTLSSVARRATEVVAAAMEHRIHPFASIVRSARADGSAVPDVSVMLAYQTLTTAELAGVRVDHEILASGSSIADVTFYVQERSDGVGLGVEYRGSVIGAADAERLLDTFERVLRRAVSSPDVTVAAATTDLAAAAGNDVVGAELAAASPTVLHEVIERAAQRPDDVAVIDAAGRSLTYAQLVGSAVDVADAIDRRIRASHGPGQPLVAVATGRRTELVAAMLGTMLAGTTYVPLDVTSPATRQQQILETASPAVVVTTRRFADAFDHPVVVELDEIGGLDVDVEALQRARAMIEALDADSGAYVIFTSGSTGRPRGVRVSHANLAASTAARAGVYDSTPTRFLMTSSVGFDSSLVGLVWPLTTGGTVVLPDDDDVGDVDRLVAVVDSRAVTHVLVVPSLYRALLERGRERLGGLTTAIVAGEACARALVETHRRVLPGVHLVNEYGPTEASVWATAARLDTMDGDTVPIGRPIPGVTVRVAGPELRPVPTGVAGELLISGATVTAGYLDDPDATAARFVHADGRRWYRTGDLVRARPDGEIDFLGRIDDQLNVGGVRLEPSEVEAVLIAQPSIVDAVVVAPTGRRASLVAHVETVGGERVDEAELRRVVGGVLPQTHVPHRIVAHESLPRTAHGKLDRQAAASLPIEVATPDAGSVGLGDAATRLVVEIWQHVLGRSDITAVSDYFESGGDSLAAVEIVSELGQRLDVEVPISALLTGRTPAGLAALVAPDDEHTADEQLVVFREGDPSGPLVVFTTGWDDVFGYQALARALRADTTVVALSTTAASTNGEAISTIDGLAAAFSDTLVRSGWVKGRRPVHVVGWSTGGVVAYDTAHRLVDDGVDVRAIVLVDTYFPGAEQHMWANRWSKYKSLLRRDAAGQLVLEARITVKRRFRTLMASAGRRLLAWSGSPVPEAPRTTSVGGVPVDAYRYRPEPTELAVVLYAASRTNRKRTVEGWRTVAPHLEIVPVDGRHRGFDSIMGPDRVSAIAADLATRL